MRRTIPLAFGGALLAGTALAQDAGRPGAAPDAPKSPPTLLPLPPDQGEGSGSSMSERLSKSQGVIRPPQEVDPAIKQEPPPTGPNSMPVIPPPGTPGGDPSVKPK
jgi:hypothetical protein